MKTKIIPFDLETAKKIQSGEIEGKIKTNGGENVRIICWDRVDSYTGPIIALYTANNGNEHPLYCNVNGKEAFSHQDLVIEVPDNEPQFKPFDKVLVRNKDHETWNARLYDVWFAELGLHGTQDNKEWKQCIPYEGNQELVGTTDKPKEE